MPNITPDEPQNPCPECGKRYHFIEEEAWIANHAKGCLIGQRERGDATKEFRHRWERAFDILTLPSGSVERIVVLVIRVAVATAIASILARFEK